MLLENDDITKYLTAVEDFDAYPVIPESTDDLIYCGHNYLNGDENVQEVINTLETNFLTQIELYVSILSESNLLSSNEFTPLKKLNEKLLRLINDEKRQRSLRDWLGCSQGPMINPELDEEVIKRIELQYRSCQFFWECLSIQLTSAEHSNDVIESNIHNLTEILDRQKAAINPTEFAFTVKKSIDYNLYQEITTVLHRELIVEGFLPQESRLATFRLAFFHPERRFDRTEILNPITWCNNSYNTLTYFVLLLQEWFITVPMRGSQKSNNKIAIKRFVKLDGQPFVVGKIRHNGNPPEHESARLQQVIAETIDHSRDQRVINDDGRNATLIDLVPKGVLTKIRLTR